ncbi:response regulator transcription factor [Flavivirga algicola]|uniref:response regulator transcription factor n=1 Tax=Flavivirga algicola TaxID=2729136 RepID=UPI00293C041B|nr:response regulator transcription factor [Flavivirga algicola]
MKKKKKIVIIEDYKLIRETYQQIINSTEAYEVIGSYESCETAFKKIKNTIPDIILIDISLPGMNGVEGIRFFKHLFPDIQIIVITVHERSDYIFDALCAGAIGYLTKTGGEKQILEALHQLKTGGAPMSSCIARRVVQSFQTKKLEDLSYRENEVLNQLSKGKSYASISETLFISINTVKTHIKNIYEKLQVTNREDAIKLYDDKRLR